MKFTKAIFKNFIGFQLGLGLDTFELDLTKSKHRIILILAPNRSGKTTLLEGLTLFSSIYSAVRDESKFIIDGKEGYRELHFVHNNIAYISKVYWLDKGTKCYLTSYENGIESELNPNGNVRSYEELLFIRFGLTKDHNKLLFLGPGLRDIISMTPGERKANISKFTPDIEIYLQLHKETTKYYTKLKNDITSIVNELHRLGDNKENIIRYREAAKAKYDSTLEKIQYLKTIEGNAKNIVNMFQVNGISVVSTYDSMVKEYNSLCQTITAHNNEFITLCEKAECTTSLSQEQYASEAQKSRDTYIELRSKAENSTTRETELVSSVQTVQSMLKQKYDDYNDYVERNNPDKFITQHKTLLTEIEASNQILASIQETVPALKENDILFTKDDATKYLMFIDNLMDRVNAIKDTYSENGILEKYITQNKYFNAFEDAKAELETEYKMILEKIQSKQTILSGFNELKSLSDMLSLIPATCKNTECVFIKKAKEYTETKTAQPELVTEITKLTQESDQIKLKLSQFDMYISKSMQLIKDMHQLSIYIDSYAKLFTKFPDFDLLSDPITLFQNTVYFLPRARSYSEYSYAHERQMMLQEKLLELESSINNAKEYYQYIEKCKKDITVLENQVLDFNTQIQHLHNDKASLLDRLRIYEGKSDALQSLLSIRSNIVVGLKRYLKLKVIIAKLRKHYIAGKAFEDKLSKLRSKISFVQDELTQYEKELNLAEYNMRTFDEYEKKKELLTSEYSVLETLRKAWSPTTGIPLIFIEGFMNNLLSSANKYLAEIWPGQDLFIDGFQIDEKNFFINIKQPDSPIAHDASVCSGAERATLTTVLSLALLKQFPKIAHMYNITKFDEIDNPLDYNTSRIFVGILNDLLDDIHSEQSFLISHNDTFDSDVDVILLKDAVEYESRILTGAYNIIYP